MTSFCNIVTEFLILPGNQLFGRKMFHHARGGTGTALMPEIAVEYHFFI